MSLSIRLDQELEKAVNQASRRTRIRKSELIRRCLKKFLSEISDLKPSSPFSVYKTLEDQIPRSGHGFLALNHREEVLKRLKAKAHR